jgi:hypothetical protein
MKTTQDITSLAPSERDCTQNKYAIPDKKMPEYPLWK